MKRRLLSAIPMTSALLALVLLSVPVTAADNTTQSGWILASTGVSISEGVISVSAQQLGDFDDQKACVSAGNLIDAKVKQQIQSIGASSIKNSWRWGMNCLPKHLS